MSSTEPTSLPPSRNNSMTSASHGGGSGSTRRSSSMRKMCQRPSLDLKHVFPHTDTEKKVIVHHERIFEGMVEDVLLTEQEEADAQAEMELHRRRRVYTTDDDDILSVETTEETDDEDEETEDDEEDQQIRRVRSTKNKMSSSLIRRHSSYNPRNRRQGMQQHEALKEQLSKMSISAAASPKGGSAATTSRLELLEHLHGISMDLSQLMKSSTTCTHHDSGGQTMAATGPGTGSTTHHTTTLAESCPVLAYIQEEDEDSIELEHGRAARRNIRRRRKRNISVIPEDEQDGKTSPIPSSPMVATAAAPPTEVQVPSMGESTYTMELEDLSEEEQDQKPRPVRRQRKVPSYHILMTSMQMADDMNDVSSIMESFSNLSQSSSKDVMHFPSSSHAHRSSASSSSHTMVLKDQTERYVASMQASMQQDATDGGKPGALTAGAPAVAMQQQPMTPSAGIARGAARGA